MRIVQLALLPAVAAIIALALAGCGDDKPKQKTLRVFCAAGVKAPAELLGEQFDDAAVEFEYAGTNNLLSRIRILPAGDLPDVFIAAEESYADDALKAGLVDRREVIAYFTPVIVVSKKYAGPKIESLKDLGRSGLRVVLGESRGPAIGKVSDKLLADAGLDEVARSAERRDTVQHVAVPVSLGAADAAIIWEDIAHQGDFADTLTIVPIPNAPASKVYMCRLTKAPDKDLADRFIDLAVSEAGRAAFRKVGFRVDPPATQASEPQP